MSGLDKQNDKPRFLREARIHTTRKSPMYFAAEPSDEKQSTKGVQDVRAGLRKQLVRVKNKPARFPPAAAWPFELRAATVAALLDFDSTRQLCKAIADGSAPRPTALRGKGTEIEAVWSRDAVQEFVVERHRSREPQDEINKE